MEKKENKTTSDITNNNKKSITIDNTITANLQNKLNTIDNVGKVPQARFGHSVILINSVKAVLFGGALGDIKSYKYSNEIFIYNLMTKIWMNMSNSNHISFIYYQIGSNIEMPSPRAAHAAVANDKSQMIIHGGSTTSELAEDEVWLFDLSNKEDEGIWKKIPTIGDSPGKRYGHSLAFMKPYFVLFGGRLTNKISNDVWALNIDKLPISWQRVDFQNHRQPLPRMYHSCGFTSSGNSQGMMIVFGGRDSNGVTQNDIWGLRKHNDDTWDWIQADIKKGAKLTPRCHHSIVFYGPLMIIVGGYTKNPNEAIPFEIYDTELETTTQFLGITLYRQSSFIKDTSLYIYGGFNSSNTYKPINTLSVLDLNSLLNGSSLYERFNEIYQNEKNSKKSFKGFDEIQSAKEEEISKPNNKFKLANQAIVFTVTNPSEEGLLEDLPAIFRKIGIEKLSEETKRIGQDKGIAQLQSKRIYNYEVIEKFINTLLRPFDWHSQDVEDIHENLPFIPEEIDILIQEAKSIISKEPTLLRIRSPCKVFGNLYGQYNDLMRFFESYRHPSDQNQKGDIFIMQYIFLGDYVDRGKYQLEVILLLLALKVKYPESISLIRGHHEDISINVINGFGEECKERLNDQITKENSVFMKINNLFNYFPLALLIDNQILCVHGGIGNSIQNLKEIESIKRPVQVIQEVTKPEHQMIVDILWSEYSDEILNVEPNEERDLTKTGNILKFGRERLNKFLNDNNLNLLITSHQWIQDGIKSFNNEKIFIVYSATNYMDKFSNLGGMICIGKKTANRPININQKLIDKYVGKNPSYQQNKKESPVRNYKQSIINNNY